MSQVSTVCEWGLHPGTFGHLQHPRALVTEESMTLLAPGKFLKNPWHPPSPVLSPSRGKESENTELWWHGRLVALCLASLSPSLRIQHRAARPFQHPHPPQGLGWDRCPEVLGGLRKCQCISPRPQECGPLPSRGLSPASLAPFLGGVCDLVPAQEGTNSNFGLPKGPL